MLDFFKNGNRGAGKGEEPVLDGRTVCRLMRHFPVGTKVRYYPEYCKELLLDSVVIAYAINDQIVYSAVNLSCDESSATLEFDDQGQHYSFKTVTAFKIILPVFSQSEAKLDYAKREELLRIGGLVKDNTITLMARHQNGQVPVLETTVEKRVILQEGFYAGQMAAFLDVDAESLMLSDQRAHLRLKTRLPATLQIGGPSETALVNGIMADFCDRSLRLVVDDEFDDETLPIEKDGVVVSFNMPGQSEQVSLVGEVYRVESRALVVMLSGFVEKGRIVALGQIEILKIKANLLQHSSTNLAK